MLQNGITAGRMAQNALCSGECLLHLPSSALFDVFKISFGTIQILLSRIMLSLGRCDMRQA